jgi:hypothetical protein
MLHPDCCYVHLVSYEILYFYFTVNLFDFFVRHFNQLLLFQCYVRTKTVVELYIGYLLNLIGCYMRLLIYLLTLCFNSVMQGMV